MADALLAQELRDRYEARVEWLENTYHGQEHQDIAKDILEGMYQGIKESPQTFYGRISAQIRRAGYDAAIIPVIAKQVFMKGIHRDIANKLAEQPRMDLAPTVALANRIWQNAHQSLNQDITLFPQQLVQEQEFRKETKKPENQAYVPPRIRRKEPQQLKTAYRTQEDYDRDMDLLTEGFKKLQAQVNDRQGYNQRYGPPTQYFGNQQPPR